MKLRIPIAVWMLIIGLMVSLQLRINSQVSQSLQFHNQKIDLLSQRIDKIKRALDDDDLYDD